MRRFTSSSWWTMTYKGNTVRGANVKNDIEYENSSNGSGLIGQTVLIDGRRYTVLGVEAYAKRVIKKGEVLGLMVKEPI